MKVSVSKMSINYIKPLSPDPLIERYGETAAALAKLGHINYLQELIAEAAPYSLVPIVLNHPVGQSPTLTVIPTEATTSGCFPPCSTKNGECTCFSLANSAPGVYTITLSKAAPAGFALIAGPLKTLGKGLTYEYVSSTEFIIRTYDILTGALENNILENTYLELKLWN